MSWNSSFTYGQSGTFGGDSYDSGSLGNTGSQFGGAGSQFGGAGSQFGSTGSLLGGAGSQFSKRPHSPDGSQMFKKPKPTGGPIASSWAQLGGKGFSDFDSGPTSWDQLGDDDSFGTGQSASDSAWDDLTGPTSWDQIAEPRSTGGAGRGRGRGDRGARRPAGGTIGGLGGRDRSSGLGGGSFLGGNFGGGGDFSEEAGYEEDQFGGEEDYTDDTGYAGKQFGNFGGGGNFSGKPRGQQGGPRRGGNQRGGGRGQQRGGGRKGGGGQQFGGPGRGGRQDGRGAQRGGFRRARGTMKIAGGNKLSLVDKFVKYADFLRKEGGIRVNAIQSLENACTSTGLNLKTEYAEDPLPRIYNRPIFTGKLCISGIFLARSIGANKKVLKHEVYDTALKVLTEKSISEINDLSDPGMESIKTSIEMFLREDVRGLAGTSSMSMEEVAQKLKDKLQMSNNLSSGVQRLASYLKTTANLPESPISQMEQGIQASKCGLPHSFECMKEGTDIGGTRYMGAFMLGDICIARAESKEGKKQCKQETYKQAVEAILTKPVSEVLIPVKDPSTEDEPEGHVEDSVLPTASDKMEETTGLKPQRSVRKSENVELRLKEFMKILMTTAFQEDNMHNMDNLANHYNLTIMCLFRKASPASVDCSGCELYIENYLIATGCGPTKKECQSEAYSKAWEVLTTSSSEEILTQHKKLSPEETAGPSVMEVFIKGATGLQRESNLHSLRRYGLDPYDKTKKAEDMVIVECADWHKDRKFNAFCILQYSATANGMLLQWSCETIKSRYRPNYRFEKKMSDRIKLTLYLQGEEIAQSQGPGKNRVRNVAAASALFNMYQTHDVIRVVRLKDEDRWIPFEQIETECNNLRKEAGQPPREVPVFEGWEAKVDEYLIAAIKAHITRFFPREDAEELLFGPGLPNAEIKVIQAYAASLKIRCDTRQYNEELYLVMYVRQEMPKVVQALKEQSGGKYGKYILVPKEELPPPYPS